MLSSLVQVPLTLDEHSVFLNAQTEFFADGIDNTIVLLGSREELINRFGMIVIDDEHSRLPVLYPGEQYSKAQFELTNSMSEQQDMQTAQESGMLSASQSSPQAESSFSNPAVASVSSSTSALKRKRQEDDEDNEDNEDEETEYISRPRNSFMIFRCTVQAQTMAEHPEFGQVE